MQILFANNMKKFTALNLIALRHKKLRGFIGVFFTF